MMLLCPPPTILSGAAGVALTGAQTLLRSLGDTYGMAIDFTDQTMEIADNGTPANNYSSTPYGKLTYTSPSDKWVLNASGVFAKVTAGAALPYEYNTSAVCQGVLIEEQRTNLLLHSNDPPGAPGWTTTTATLTANAATGPDGVANSAHLWTSNNTGYADFQQSVTTSGSVVVSCFVKAGNSDYFMLSIFDSGHHKTWFHLSGAGSIGTDAAGNTSGIVALANGWYRVWFARSISANPYFVGFFAQADGADPVNNGTGYWYNAHLEQAAYVSSPLGGSPIFTTTGSVTRAADKFSLATSAFPYNQPTGAIYASVKTGSCATGYVAPLSDGTYVNVITMYNPGAFLSAYIANGNVAQMNTSLGTGGLNQNVKGALAYAANDFAGSVGGAAVVTDVSGSVPTATTFNIAAFGASGEHINSYVKQIAYWPRRLSNAELQTVTT